MQAEIFPEARWKELGYQAEMGGIENIDPQGRFFERAIARAQLSRWKIMQEA